MVKQKWNILSHTKSNWYSSPSLQRKWYRWASQSRRFKNRCLRNVMMKCVQRSCYWRGSKSPWWDKLFLFIHTIMHRRRKQGCSEFLCTPIRSQYHHNNIIIKWVEFNVLDAPIILGKNHPPMLLLTWHTKAVVMDTAENEHHFGYHGNPCGTVGSGLGDSVQWTHRNWN